MQIEVIRMLYLDQMNNSDCINLGKGKKKILLLKV